MEIRVRLARFPGEPRHVRFMAADGEVKFGALGFPERQPYQGVEVTALYAVRLAQTLVSRGATLVLVPPEHAPWHIAFGLHMKHGGYFIPDAELPDWLRKSAAQTLVAMELSGPMPT